MVARVCSNYFEEEGLKFRFISLKFQDIQAKLIL